ncbi:MAG: hypothetical protein P8P88_02140 [Polaribacter sp.]|nr:hypothetical protein [Polaribacter sp.]
MSKIFRQNRRNSLTEGKAGNYFKYALGEIILVVMGILIALYINNYNSELIEKKAAISSYKNIKRQINDDKYAIHERNEQNKQLYEKYLYASDIIEQNDRKKIDTLGQIALALTDYSDFDRSSTIYQNLLNSGESKLLKNKDILNQIQKLEELYTFINRLEKTHSEVVVPIGFELVKYMKFKNGSVREPEKLFGIDFQNYFLSMHGICDKKEYAYRLAIDKIEQITKLIEDEIK